jgi:hypothetical protein
MHLHVSFRSLVQIKSHAQKVMKRMEEGEDVFRRLEDNSHVVDSLIKQAAKDRDAIVRGVIPATSKTLSVYAKEKRSPSIIKKKSDRPSLSSFTASHPPNPLKSPDVAAKDSVLAAAALCQLSHKD